MVKSKKFRDRVDYLIPAIADAADALEQLANHENRLVAQPARHLLGFLGANMLL
jgi:hypothetical protein